MGFDKNGTRLLLYARRRGVNFQHTVTIGRQGLHLSAATLDENLREFGYEAAQGRVILGESEGFAEAFLRRLGAEKTDSIDASTYENATHQHDMNHTLPVDWQGRYSVVIDGGSLEHVFNFPTAIKNCMELVRENGHCIILTECNNYLGHGFYQFSPELFYRIFSAENGFAVESMLFYTDLPKSPWYAVADPAQVKSRVTLHNAYSSCLCVIARRTAIREIFATTPQQSDYQWISWQDSVSETRVQQAARHEQPASSWMPRGLVRLVLRARYRWQSLRVALRATGSGKAKFFQKIDPLQEP